MDLDAAGTDARRTAVEATPHSKGYLFLPLGFDFLAAGLVFAGLEDLEGLEGFEGLAELAAFFSGFGGAAFGVAALWAFAADLPLVSAFAAWGFDGSAFAAAAVAAG